MVHSVGMSPTCTFQDLFFLPSKWHAENKIVDVLNNNTVSCDEVLVLKKKPGL